MRVSQQNSITSAQPGRFYVRSAKIRLCVFMHPVRDQQIALAPPADFAVLGVRFESRRIGKLKLMRQNDIVRAKILIAKAVGSIEMLINAEEPRVLKRRVVIGLSLEDPRKGLMQTLLLQYDAARGTGRRTDRTGGEAPRNPSKRTPMRSGPRPSANTTG